MRKDMTMPVETAITASDLTKRYGKTVAVDALSLEIPPGTVYAFLGPNGAGKTTTIQMLTTLTVPTSGEATIMGHPITDREQVTKQIGLLPADPPVYPELTGREHLWYVAKLHEIPMTDAKGRIERLVERFDLDDAIDKRIDGYSTGMKKKLGIIATTLHDPPVLFFDEPTSGLDPRAARTVRDTISELVEANRAIFLSTHILPVAEELADIVGVIHNGRLVAEGPPDELTNTVAAGDSPNLETVFLAVTQAETEAYEHEETTVTE